MAFDTSDSETYSTPPTTPTILSCQQLPAAAAMPPARRGSRPSSLALDSNAEDTTGYLIQDAGSSPEPTSDFSDGDQVDPTPPSNRHLHHMPPSTSPLRATSTDRPKLPRSHSHPPPMKSPCFIHSLLDKGASFSDWLKVHNQSQGLQMFDESRPNQPAPSRHPSMTAYTPPDLSYGTPSGSERSSPRSLDDDDGVGSLTRQLAETAVGVREMSRQLGRARVRSNFQNVLIVTKARDNRLIKLTRELALYLMQKPRDDGRGLVVYVDSQLRHSKRFDAAGIERDHPELFYPAPRRRASSSSLISMSSESTNGNSTDEGQLRYWTSEMCNKNSNLFDFVVTLGGDGTVLFTSWLFQKIVPPVLPFALGSLGFLTNFDFADYASVMDNAIDSGIRVNLRMRFTCTVYRAVAPEEGKGRKAVKKAETGEILMKNLEKGGWEALEGGYSGTGNGSFSAGPCGKDKEVKCFTTRPVESFEVLNDLVVDRGPSPYVSLLELFGDEHHMTTVQADGLTVSTPTGSTAYSLSAGGSLVHPEIPAILITPICPHTLSFRPMLLPDTMELRICVPFNSRSTAWASFDGRGRVELRQGDHIKVTASKYPFPTVCADKQSTDWFHAISRTLKWNERERQKSFVVVEEGPAQTRKRSIPETKRPDAVELGPEHAIQEEDEEEDEEDEDDDEEEKFDIDDSSAVQSSAASMIEPPSHKISAGPSTVSLGSGTAAALRRAGISDSKFSMTGIDSPDRFGQPHPHPPAISPRHAYHPPSSDVEIRDGEQGDRDHIHSPRDLLAGNKSKIPTDPALELDANSLKTPRPGADKKHQHHPHVASPRFSDSGGLRKAFAVWGHDESDPSDNDSIP